ncbi:hypothetical protein A9Q86_04620 [Flavobacteriales bacterium 33_180_T64]|mgnify:CR=1 FL=1|nr:hypothetical protein A9Q86_04620 [Flavobacteriales bacterium 33_180_T64]
MTQKKLDTIKTSGFKTPKDYFSQVEEQILNEVSLIDKANHSGFEVPGSYFESLESKILDKVNPKNDTPVISLFSWKKLVYTSAIAASLILMFTIFTPSEITFEDIETASIEYYIEQEGFSNYDLASLLTEEELSTVNFIDNEILEETIEDYLLDNVDIEELIIE